MKKLLMISFVLMGILVFSQTKKAFLIGIGNYQEANKGWGNISGDKDIINHIKPMLIKNGFKKANIVDLVNERATKDTVLKSFQNFAAKVDFADQVFIYFATHGQLISDVDGDETSDDVDEAIVLHDSPKCIGEDNTYKGEKHLIDDEIKIILDSIRTKAQKKGIVFMGVDACFSGDTNKALDFTECEKIVSRGDAEYNTCFIKGYNASSDALDLKKLYTVDNDDFAPFVLLTASTESQLNYQKNDDIGSLTYAITNHVKDVSRDKLSFDVLFNLVKDSFHSDKHTRDQSPTCKGCDRDKSVFFYNANSPRKTYYVTSYIENGDENEFKWNYGKLMGFTEGTLMEIRNLKDSLLGYASINKANELESVFITDKRFSKQTLNQAIFVPLKLNYFTKNFTIDIPNRIRKKIDTFLFIKKVGELHDPNSKYQLKKVNDEFEITQNNKTIIPKFAKEQLESQLIYLSYLDYVDDLIKRTKAKNSYRQITDDLFLECEDKGEDLSNYYFNIDDNLLNSYFVLFSLEEKRLIFPYEYYYNAFLNKSTNILMKNDIEKLLLVVLDEDIESELRLNKSIFFQPNFYRLHNPKDAKRIEQRESAIRLVKDYKRKLYLIAPEIRREDCE